MFRFRHEIDPHLFATSASAYRGVRDYKKDQSILVSGESGAGKTESVKILMGHIAHISGNKRDQIIKKVLKANPLLESFGNAKTTRNDNSSRFGKFTQLQMDECVTLVGSKCVTYLLEKSRVISQNENERNYHIFHELFSAPEGLKSRLKLDGFESSDFAYMQKGDNKTKTIEGISDSDRFSLTMETLGLMGLSEADIYGIFEILAGIIHLGQVKFCGQDGDKDKSMIDPASLESVRAVCAFFRVELEDFKERVVIRHIEVVGEEMHVPLNVDQAYDGRDALAKEVYARLFSWLVGVINSSTASNENVSNTVSLLDIFGFECFQTNRFEQLCINYANEKLQQKFTLDIFLTVQAEYKEEGLEWEQISYKDNADILELIEGKVGKVVGLMAVLNEECLMPKGKDANLLGKLRKQCSSHSSFSYSLSGKQSKDEFCITHYAGKVAYNVNGFVERNRDTLANESRLMMMDSDNPILADIFAHVDYSSQTSEAARPSTVNTTHSTLVAKGKRVSIGTQKGFLKAETTVTKFKGQLNALMESVGRTDVQYVRCIKPNSTKCKSNFNRKMVVEQLRCAGMIEAIRITRAAYPYRVLQAVFINRFSRLKTKAWNRENCGANVGEHCLKLLRELIRPPKFIAAIADQEKKLFEVGKTKVYFTCAVLEFLEDQRSKLLYNKIVLIQSSYRSSSLRKWFVNVRRATILIQKVGRTYLCRGLYLKFMRSLISLQCAVRISIAKIKLSNARYNKAVVRLQALIRMLGCRHRFIIMRRSAEILSKWFKMCLEAKRYEYNRTSNAEQTKLAAKVEKLRKKLESESDAITSKSKTGKSEVAFGQMQVELREDVSILSKLQEEMSRLKKENRLLYEENQSLKESGRKEQFNLDSKIAVVAVGKATIHNLEMEISALRKKLEKNQVQIRQFKIEKKHVVDSLLALSNEIDGGNKEMKRFRSLYEIESMIRQSQLLHERDVGKRVHDLLRNRGIDYSDITENHTRMCDLIHLYSTDALSHDLWESNKARLCTVSSDDEGNMGGRGFRTPRRKHRSHKSSKSRCSNDGEKLDESDDLSTISGGTDLEGRIRKRDERAEKEKTRGRRSGRGKKIHDHVSSSRKTKTDVQQQEVSTWWSTFFS